MDLEINIHNDIIIVASTKTTKAIKFSNQNKNKGRPSS